MTTTHYLELARLVAPEILVVLTAFLVLAIDLVALSELEIRARLLLCSTFVSVGCLIATVWMFAFPLNAMSEWNMFEANGLTRIVKSSLLGLTVLSLWLAHGSNFTRHVGEYFTLLLLSAAGMMLLVSSRDLLTIFVSLELSTVPLYILAALTKDSNESTQSALKYFLFGGISAAITLFGFSLLYGFAGGTDLYQIAAAVTSKPLDPLAGTAAVLVTAGIGFKIAAAPFHLWTPEVYRNSPVSTAAFIGSASKVAGIFILAIIFTLALNKGSDGSLWGPGSAPSQALTLVAAFSIILGSLAAIAQQDLRQLLAYSAVANAGYMLLGVLSNTPWGMAAVVYYAVTYGIATLGAFGIASIAGSGGSGCRLNRLEGLHSSHPALAACLMVFILSLAGIPPLAGFFGKYMVFVTLVSPAPYAFGRLLLLALALAASAVSLFYYLRVLKFAYVSTSRQAATPLISPARETVLIAAALIVVLLGVFPQVFLGALLRMVH